MRIGRFAGVALAAAAAAVLSIGPASGSTDARSSGAARCRSGEAAAVIAGKRLCLRAGQRCSRGFDRRYHRYGFHCHSGRLTRGSKPPNSLPAAGKVIAKISVPSFGGIAVGGDAVWVANLGPGTVTRIDPLTNAVEATIQIGARSENLGFGPTFLAFGHGSLWVLDGASSSVFRIDPLTNRIVASVPLGSGTQGTTAPLGIAVAGDAVWVANRWGTEYGPDGSVVRIDPLTNSIVASVGLGTRPDGGGPTMLAAGAEGVWVGIPSSRSIARVDPKTTLVVASLPDLECAGGQLALAPDEASVWVADCTAVRRIDTKTNAIAKTIPIPGATLEPGVQAVAIGFGSVWAQGGRLVRIDPASGALTGTLPLTELGVPCAYSIAFGFGSVWVRQVEQILRIKP